MRNGLLPRFHYGLRVVLALGWADFCMKYRGSMLGFLWSFLLPLVKFLVIFHIFRPFARDIPFYSLYLFLGIIFWEHFALTTTGCMTMLHYHAPIIKQIRFPRLLLILSVGWMHILILLSYLCVFFFVQLFIGGAPGAAAVLLPVLLLEATLLALGIGMFLSAFALRFRDIPHLWEIVLQVFFWLTPVLYAYRPQAPLFADALSVLKSGVLRSVWDAFDLFIRFQPLSVLLFDARRILLYPTTAGVPTVGHLLGFLTLCALVFAAGAAVFQRRSRYFLQEY